jgi:hypothetical protein
MSQLSFTHVPATGFSAFHAKCTTGTWALIDISAYEGASATPLWNASTLVVVKVRTKKVVTELLHSIEGAGGAKGCDRIWDSCQKQLNGLIGVAAVSNDPAKRDAAGRLQKLLLLGAGEGQTRLRYQEEVDFGRKQAALVAQGQSASDVALLGLGPVITEIVAATNALAAAIGHDNSVVAPHRRKAIATMACVSTFGWAAESLGWMVEHAGAGPDRELAEALLATLDELVARYPATTTVATPAPNASPPPSP